MLGIPLGIGVILLGLKGFSQAGIPWNRQKQITGGKAKAIGTACILLGLFFIGEGVFSATRLLKQNSSGTKNASADSLDQLLQNAQAVWEPYSLPEGKFAILMPGIPRLDRRRDEVECVAATGSRVYQVTLAELDLEGANARELLAQMPERLAKIYQGKLRESKELEIEGQPAVEMTCDFSDGSHILSRLVHKDGELYQMIVVVGKDAEPSADPQKFFDSFRFAPHQRENFPFRSSQQPPRRWGPYQAPAGGFQVLVPDKPEVVVGEPSPGIAEQCRYQITGPDTHYLIIYLRMEPHVEDPTALLNSSQEVAIQKTEGKLRTATEIQVGDYPGRELIFDQADEQVVRQRIIVADDRLFEIMVVGLKGIESYIDTNRFFESFQIRPQTEVAEPAQPEAAAPAGSPPAAREAAE